MATLKRRVARLIERLSGNLVIPRHIVHVLPERLHLRRFLAELEVDCVFDVGANTGQYVRMLREEVGFTGRIISYEPLPELASDLAERAHADPHWHVEALALDREAGPATFHVMRSSDFSSLHAPKGGLPELFSNANAVLRRIEVMRATLAEELPRQRARFGFRRPFLKMDTQGNDLAVAAGAGALLREFVGLQSELSIRPLYDGVADFAEVIAEYRRQGFELSAFVPDNPRHFPLLIETDCIMVRRDLVPARLLSQAPPA